MKPIGRAAALKNMMRRLSAPAVQLAAFWLYPPRPWRQVLSRLYPPVNLLRMCKNISAAVSKILGPRCQQFWDTSVDQLLKYPICLSQEHWAVEDCATPLSLGGIHCLLIPASTAGNLRRLYPARL